MSATVKDKTSEKINLSAAVGIFDVAKRKGSPTFIHTVGDDPARALRALGLLLADGAPTVGGGKTF